MIGKTGTTTVALLMLASPAVAETRRGRRVSAAATSNGITCNRTDIRLDVRSERITGRLTYDGARVSGTMSGRPVRMTASSKPYSYAFEGTVSGRSMRGTWKEAGTGCRGTWHTSGP